MSGMDKFINKLIKLEALHQGEHLLCYEQVNFTKNPKKFSTGKGYFGFLF